jgi:Ca-activated chloride channel family protein
MKPWWVILFLGALLPLAPAQNSAEEDLPAAPSAVRQQSKQEQKPAPAAPQQTAPAPTPAPKNAVQPPAEEPAAKSSPSTPTTTAPATNPQSSPAPPPSDDVATTIVRVVNEVNVVFTVTDKHGRYVKDLKKNDFRVMDDSKPADEIRSFHSETDLPLQVGLLVDASNSVRDRFKFEQESAIEFLNQTVRPRYDKAFVVGFDATPEVTQDFTDNTEALSRGVRQLRPGGGTAMYDALYFACRDKLLKAEQTGTARRAIILLTDGEDNQSHVTREEAIEMAQRAEVIVYTISTNVTGSRQRGDKILERIADATGGRAFFPFQITDVADAFAEIQDELRSQYALSYKPADFRTDGRFHSIEILAQNHKSLRVRSRRGYYAPAQ